MRQPLQNDLSILFGLALALTSTGALVLTLKDLVTGTEAKILACLAGVALQGCLYLFAHHEHHRIRIFSSLLLLLSILFTTWYLENTWQARQAHRVDQAQQSIQQEWQNQQQQQQVSDLNHQINIMLVSAQTDINNGYRDRGLTTLARVEDLKKQRQALTGHVATQQQAVALKTSAFEQITWVRLTLFGLIALIIDLSAILAMKPVRAVTEKHNEKATPDQGARPKPTQNPLLDNPSNEYQTIMMAIVQGDVAPSKNQVRKQMNIGATKVGDYFRRMVSEGVLQQDNRGYYQLAS